mgnify:FL=1
MNIPNFLTVIRFMLIPVFGYYLLEGQYKVAVILFLLSSLTDILDGYIARKFNMITPWGKLADPLADKLMQLTATILLIVQKKIPLIILFVVAAKELLMGAGSIFLYKKKNYVVSSNWYGKMATVIFNCTIVLIILFNFSSPINDILIWTAVLSTMFAFVMYFKAFVNINKKT